MPCSSLAKKHPSGMDMEWYGHAGAGGSHGACGRGCAQVTHRERAGGGSLPVLSCDRALARRTLYSLSESAWGFRAQMGPSGQVLPSSHSPSHVPPSHQPEQNRAAVWDCLYRGQWPGAGGGIWPLRGYSLFVSFQWSVFQIPINLIKASGGIQGPHDTWRKDAKATQGRAALLGSLPDAQT